jgi:predicted O-linked N-acetylglucosamine transferase (SPINDLY family)
MNDEKPRAGGWQMAGPRPAAPVSGQTQRERLEKELAAIDEIMKAGNFVLAEKKYREIVAAAPDMAVAHNNLGNALGALERYDEALASYSRALELKPDSAGGHNNRGNILWDMKRFEESLEAYDRAIMLNPDLFEGHNNRGNALLSLGRHEDAIKSWDKALELNPELVAAHNNRGNALLALQRYEEAIESWKKALELSPNFVEAHVNCGNAFYRLGRYEEALKHFSTVMELNAGQPFNAGMIVGTKLSICEWNAFVQNRKIISTEVRAGNPIIMPFGFLAFSESPAEQRQCSDILVQRSCPRSLRPLWQGEKYDHDRIRIAYISADFHDHPMAFLMSGLFENHDRSRFETYAISFGPDRPSEVRTRLENAFDHFLDVPLKSPEAIAQLIRELEIDIAIDRKGHTRDSRPEIFALRPAPVQAAWLAYPGTFGGDYMDYIIADRFVIPEDQQEHYSEKVVYLPDSYQANDSKRRIAEHTPSRTEVGLPEDGFVFCSFNPNHKILPGMFDIWMRLLQKVENSVLWLWVSNQLAMENLRREASARGVNPARLVFMSRIPNPEHLARHRLADLFLDTLPFNGHTTASDALWAGLPVVTCTGTTFAGRVATSLLHAVGMPELVTDSLEAYEALALQLACDRDALVKVKKRLSENRDHCPLFDTDRTRRHVEAAYEIMWKKSQAGELPEGFAVPAIDG